MIGKFRIENGFTNHGKDPFLTGKLIDREIESGDYLLINETIKIPVLEVKQISPSIIINIPKEFESDSCGISLFELYGKEFNVIRI